ncbi:MAG: protein-tyrosine-phosphatase [Alphaproteobacteria bacterium]|nr:MAG: protein-tyrosine-phosphatase [Alphaproteobacteria bacterium]
MNFNLVRLENFGSEICLSAFPGRNHTNVFSIDLMEEFFDFLDSNRYRSVVSLVEVHEFDQFISYPKFEEKIGKRNFSWFFHPLKDMTAPDEIFRERFFETQSHLLENLRSGKKIAIHCKGGLGRSGTIAALLLRHLGFSAEKSIELVRKSRPGAIETEEQEIFIQSNSGR